MSGIVSSFVYILRLPKREITAFSLAILGSGIAFSHDTLGRALYSVSFYTRYEMYAGQFPASSGLSNASSGRILNTGWGFEGLWANRLGKGTTYLEFGVAMDRYRRFYAAQGEELKGMTQFGGFSSPPVPYETYYRAELLAIRLGMRFYIGGKHPSSLRAGVQLANFSAYFGDKSGKVRYSDSFSKLFPGYYLRAQQDFVVYSKQRPLLSIGVFVGFNALFTANQDKTIDNFLWQGVSLTISQGMHGASAYVIGVALTL